MVENKIELKSVSDLLGMNFFIPSYQRGYRWTEQQVKDLLDDIWEFAQKKNKCDDEFYCLQPLVVKSREGDVLDQIKKAETIEEVKTLLKGSWEVIDGQQRLTTTFIILSELGITENKRYSLKYETREGSEAYLNNINDVDNKNIDYHHIFQSKQTVLEWFKDEDKKKEIFKDILLNRVRFIWYETDEADPIKVFTRLNIGKISLTNAELIKALFLNRSNFGNEDGVHLRLRQQEIASEWDNIEYTLQNDEFWLFLHKKGYDRPTRIDFIFDLICEQNEMKLSEDHLRSIGTDEYKTFRYFYECFKQENNKSKIETCWAEVKKYFQTFNEWFNDLEFYHYVGYLIHQGERLDELYKSWNDESSKEKFISNLKNKIKGRIKDCNDLDKQYEIDGEPKKTICRPLLLLHNIQTIINQNKDFENKKEYELPVFYKFPFHLFKKEKWDVEHIDSNTTNELEKSRDQKEWLKYSILDAELDNELKEKIKLFIQDKDSEVSFNELAEEIEPQTPSSWENPEQNKNKVWNFVLLDAGTNRGYGNSIFPAKRRCIIGKDQGKSYIIDDDLNVSMENGAIAFIPPVTKNVFLKYYNTSVDNLREWNEKDATAYKQNILDTLKEFGVKDSSISVKTEELLSNNQNTENDEQ